MNGKAYERYCKSNATQHDKEYIEDHIWYPNHLKAKELIMGQSHHLAEMPEEILDLLQHINVWLSEYERKRIKGESGGPIFAGPRGYRYPRESDTFIFNTTNALRARVNSDRM